MVAMNSLMDIHLKIGYYGFSYLAIIKELEYSEFHRKGITCSKCKTTKQSKNLTEYPNDIMDVIYNRNSWFPLGSKIDGVNAFINPDINEQLES